MAAWLALILCVVSPAVADEPSGVPDVPLDLFEVDSKLPVALDAESLEYDSTRDLYVARGNVRIRQGDRELRAEWMAFSNRTGRGVASGDVVFTDGIDTIRTSFIEFGMENLQGVMFDARFDVSSSQMELQGAEIAKTGDQTYRFKDGEFTTCRCPDEEDREPWELKIEEADLELNGYAKAKNSRLEILGVPVIWLPWMIYPLKTERQSGLLFPKIALSGRNGYELGLPIFWAAGDPVNVTFTPRWMSKRGFKEDLTVDYVLGQESEGNLFGSFIHDQRVDADTLKTPFGKNRWATLGTHDLHAPGEIVFRTQYAFASDNAHPNDFTDLRYYRAARYLPATAFADRHFGGGGQLGLSAGAEYSNDLQAPDDTDRDEFLLQRLPTASLHGLPFALPFARWLAPSVDLDYAWFQQGERPEKAFPDMRLDPSGLFYDSGIDGLPDSSEQATDGLGTQGGARPDPNADNAPGLPDGFVGGTEGDGLFQEGELLADDGHRMIVQPRLGVPLRIADTVELYSEAGWHQTLYQSDVKGFEQRGMLTGRVDLRTRLRGQIGEVSHLLEPRLGWAYVERVSQRSNPLFVPPTAVPQRRLRELDLDNVTRDPADRIEHFNGLTAAIGNRFYGPPGETGAPPLLADVVLSALYNFNDSDFGLVVLDGRAYPFEGVTSRFNLGFDPENARIDEGLLSFEWIHSAGHSLDLGYRYIRDIPRFFEAYPEQNERFRGFRARFDKVNQLNGGFRLLLTDQWAITYRAAYTFEQSLLLANQGGIEYLSRCKCWAVRLEVEGDRSRGVDFKFLYTLVGLGDNSARNPFQSGGQASPFSFLDGF